MKNDRQIPKTLAGALGGEQIGNVIAVSIREKGITARLEGLTQLKLRETDIAIGARLKAFSRVTEAFSRVTEVCQRKNAGYRSVQQSAISNF